MRSITDKQFRPSAASPKFPGSRRTAIGVAVAAIAAASGGVQAFQFKTNPDLNVRFDNTFKYTLGVRVQDIEDRVVAPNDALGRLADDADLGWEPGDITTNRVDLLSEFDFIWKENYGFRISGAAWYDHSYRNGTNHPGYNKYMNPITPASLPPGTYDGFYSDTWGSIGVPPGELSDDAKFRSYRGAELLDAFVFANFNIGEEMAFSVRAGRHTIYWGNSLFLAGAVQGIAGAMTTLDADKGFSVPGTSAKELFRPTNKLSGTFQFSQNFSVVGYYSFEFESAILPQQATYQSRAEGLTHDNDQFATLQAGIVDPETLALVVPRAGFSKTDDEEPGAGEWGIGFNYYFEESGWDVGLYFINYNDKLPQGLNGAMDLDKFVSLRADAGGPAFQQLQANWPQYNNGVAAQSVDVFTGGGYPALGYGNFNWVFKDDNKLLGLSLSNELWGISFGADFVYRKDVAINTWLAGQLQHVTDIPPDIPAPINDLIANQLESNGFAYDNWDYFGKDPSNYPGTVGDTWHIVFNGVGLLEPTSFWDGGAYSFELTASSLIDVTDNEQLLNPKIKEGAIASTIAIGFSPTWFQVLPALDLTLRINGNVGMSGEAPVIAFGGTKGFGAAAVGFDFNYRSVWRSSIRYNWNFGPRDAIAGNTTDRGNLNLSITRTF
jgi:hypothetical protein